MDQGMAVAAVRALPEKIDSELRTRYRHLRVMLHAAGLTATYAYMAAKAGPGDGASSGLAGAYRGAAKELRVRLAEMGLLPGDAAQMSVRDVMRELGAMDPVRYARASAEAAAFAGWLSRLADAAWQEGKRGA